MPDKKTFLILDGNALLHRAWHAIPPLTTQDGRVVNAVYGFAMVVEKMLERFAPDFMAVAWDLPGGTFRHEEYKAYKATREKKAPELYAQIPMIQELLLAYNIPSLSAPGFEADDVIGTIASHNARQGYKTLIVTGDLDALQLVDEFTHVVFFVKGLSETKLYDPKTVHERYGLRPDQLIDLKTLLGDVSDNLPGVPGIGEKTAFALLQEFGTVQGIFDALKSGKVPEKYAKKLNGQEEHAKQMRRMVTIVRDVDLNGFDVSTATVAPPKLEVLVPLLRDLEFKTLLKKYQPQAIGEGTVPRQQGKKTTNGGLKTVKFEEIMGDRLGFLLDAKATDLFGGTIARVGLCDGERCAVIDEPDAKALASVVARLAQAKTIVVHDGKTALHVLHDAGVDVAALLNKPFVDTMVAAYLLSPGDREFAFDDIVRDAFAISAEAFSERLAVLLPLADALLERLEKEGMGKLATEIEFPLMPVLFAMERDGIEVDAERLRKLSTSFDAMLQKLTKEIYTLAGRELNINSPSQLAVVLFDDLRLPTKGIKKTKSGFSTAASELEKLADAHAIVPLIGEYREVAKLKSTYADSLPGMIGEDGRIHARFNQCIAATGRLSSSDPNLQNIPIRSELGNEIRKAFVAQNGFMLVAADYSQIELRLAAAIAKDKAFIDAFHDGADIHRRTAAEMWAIPEDKVTKDQRFAAKAINFGILYGIGPRSLARSAGVSFDEAKDFIDRYFVAHPGIASYLEEMKVRAHADGFVQTLFGRRRYLPDINSNVPQLVAASERMAINMPVQGTQADIIKMAMKKVADWLAQGRVRATMLLQVHDELVFEVHKDDVHDFAQELRKIMTNIVDLPLPLVVDIEAGQNWGEMEDVQ